MKSVRSLGRAPLQESQAPGDHVDLRGGKQCRCADRLDELIRFFRLAGGQLQFEQQAQAVGILRQRGAGCRHQLAGRRRIAFLHTDPCQQQRGIRVPRGEGTGQRGSIGQTALCGQRGGAEQLCFGSAGSYVIECLECFLRSSRRKQAAREQ